MTSDLSDAARIRGALILHGFTGHPSSVVSLADAFTEAGFDVEMPLLPGHGTTVADMIPTRWADWSAAAEAALERLQRRCSQVVVAGLSMGGTLALWLATCHPDLHGVIAVNPAGAPQPDEILVALEELVEQGIETMPGIGSDIAQEGEVEQAYDETPIAALISLMREGVAPLVDHYGEARVPLLLVTSRQDHVVDPAQSDLVAGAWGGGVTRMVLDRSFHVATQDLDRADIAARAVAFAVEPMP
jgi:carboxylesterase